jgi:hypothetical protein
MPTLAEAFTALLAAEQASGAATPASGWYESAVNRMSDTEWVERIAARVMDRVGDESIRGLVADKVADVAERMVREEIERIKNNIT